MKERKLIEEGEKNSSYFLALESHCQANNCIGKLLGENGQMASTDEDILKIITNFYTNLYNSKKPKISEINDSLRKCKVKKKLSRVDSDSCEGFIANKECKYALNSMKTNKSPGLDELTVEFYRTFWDILLQLLIDSCTEAFRDGSLSDSRNIVVMSLILKKNDRSDIKNYRPISLANINYKILAFVLANRLQNVLSKLISHDQTGYVKGRLIGFNIRKMLDVIDYLEKHNKTGLLLLLDFEKAFDSVKWDFI